MLCIRGTSHGHVSVCLSVCFSVRPPQVGVLLKRLNESSWFLARRVQWVMCFLTWLMWTSFCWGTKYRIFSQTNILKQCCFWVAKSYTACHCTYSLNMAIFWTWIFHKVRGKSGPALGGTEYRLMPSACRLIVRAKLWNLRFRYLVTRAPMRRRSIVVV